MVSGSSLGEFGEATGKLTPLTHALVAAWPSEHYRDAILSLSIENLGSLHPAMSAACSGFRTPPSPKELLQLPPPGTAPAAIAHKLLNLGTYLQVVLSSHSGHEATGLSPDYQNLMSRVFETVNILVTHNDNIPGSVEVIEVHTFLQLDSSFTIVSSRSRASMIIVLVSV
jgi:hypothetical protein